MGYWVMGYWEMGNAQRAWGPFRTPTQTRALGRGWLVPPGVSIEHRHLRSRRQAAPLRCLPRHTAAMDDRRGREPGIHMGDDEHDSDRPIYTRTNAVHLTGASSVRQFRRLARQVAKNRGRDSLDLDDPVRIAVCRQLVDI